MLRRRIHPGMWPYDFPDDILDWLKRFEEECDLSWAETARRLKTLSRHHKALEGRQAAPTISAEWLCCPRPMNGILGHPFAD